MVPDFDTAFLKTQKMPPGCNVPKAAGLLFDGASHAFALWVAATKRMEQEDEKNPSEKLRQPGLAGELQDNDPLSRSNSKLIPRRLGGWDMGRDRIEWWADDSNIGDVHFAKRTGFNDEFRSSFSNTVQHALRIAAGGVHVAVGFLDLGVLAETLAAQQHAQRAQLEMACMRWVGVEQSAFCCARTLVIVQMLQGGADAALIVQVRYPNSRHRRIAFIVEDMTDRFDLRGIVLRNLDTIRYSGSS